MYKVKICGISEAQHLNAAVESGASYVGFVFFEKSRRNISIETAQLLANQVPKGVVRVALLVNPRITFIRNVLKNVPIDMLQLHGQETIERVKNIKKITNLPVMKAIGVATKKDLVLVDRKSVV